MKASGKFVVRTSIELHLQLRDLARKNDISLNQLCLNKLSSSGEKFQFNFLDKLPFAVTGVLLYGSVARGEQTQQSDIDWLLIIPDEHPIDRQIFSELDRLTLPDRRISLNASHLVKDTRQTSNFWLELSLDAEVLYDPSGEVRKSLLEIRKEIANGTYRRFLTHGQPYWVNEKAIAKPKIS